MHQKKSEVQIGKESSGVSSDFNPTPFPPSIHHKQQSHNFQSTPHLNPNDSDTNHPIWIVDPITQQRLDDPIPKTNPHKRPLLTQTNPNHNTNSSSSNSLSKSPTLSNSLYQYPFYSTPSPFKSHYSFNFPNPKAAVAGLLSAAARWALKIHSRFVSAQQPSLDVGNKKVVKTKVAESHRTCPWSRLTFRRPPKPLLHHLRRIQIHLRLVLLLSLPVFYFLVSHPSHSFLLDFLAAFAFSSALLFSLNLAVPRLPSIRLFFSRTFPIKSRPPLPVFWSIGSRRKSEKRVDSGCWVQVYSNGDVYEGEFHKGKCSGSGVYYYYMSGRYEGDWVDGKYDGYGVETWARGSRYRGQYRQGLRNGFGVYRFYTGDVYAGEWSNGQSHGCGIHTCDDGSRFVGEFKWGVKHGLGHYHFRNGDSYAGEYFADKMHGFGMYRFANGHRYEGAWHEGKRQGLGMYTFRNGETQSGQWNNGILDVPSTQNTTYPVSPVAVYHSRVLNTVQEVRRAAEIAYDVAKVDERVNRAVAAANRAANAARVAAVKAVQSQMH